MCLKTKWTEPITIKEDITTWKVVKKDRDRYYSICFGSEYVFDKLYTVPQFGLYDLNNIRFVHQGLHSYLTEKTAMWIASSSRLQPKVALDRFILECLIPAGSQVYISYENYEYLKDKEPFGYFVESEIVSNQLIVIKEIFPWERTNTSRTVHHI